MDIVDLIERAKADGVKFRASNGRLSFGTTSETEHWLDELLPLKEEILIALGEAPPKVVPETNGKPTERIANHYVVDKKPAPICIGDIINDIAEKTGNWPRRVDNVLFVDDEHGISWFDRRTSNALFGWLHRQFHVDGETGRN